MLKPSKSPPNKPQSSSNPKANIPERPLPYLAAHVLVSSTTDRLFLERLFESEQDDLLYLDVLFEEPADEQLYLDCLFAQIGLEGSIVLLSTSLDTAAFESQNDYHASSYPHSGTSMNRFSLLALSRSMSADAVSALA